MACAKQFSIEVQEEGGLDFDNLVWGPGTFQINGVDVPEQPSLEGDWNENEWDNDVDATSPDNHLVANTGTLTYTGPLVNCNLHIDVSVITPSGLFIDPNSLAVTITQDAATILSLFAFDFPAAGPYDFPFTVIAGTNSVISVAQNTQCLDNPHIAHSAILTPA